MFYEQHVKKGHFKMNSSGKVSTVEISGLIEHVPLSHVQLTLLLW